MAAYLPPHYRLAYLPATQHTPLFIVPSPSAFHDATASSSTTTFYHGREECHLLPVMEWGRSALPTYLPRRMGDGGDLMQALFILCCCCLCLATCLLLPHCLIPYSAAAQVPAMCATLGGACGVIAAGMPAAGGWRWAACACHYPPWPVWWWWWCVEWSLGRKGGR